MGILGVISGMSAGVFVANRLEGVINWIEKIINKVGFWAKGMEWDSVELIPHGVYYFDKLPIHIDWNTLIYISIIIVYLVFLVTLIPANRASLQEPITIIREGDK